MELKEVIEAGLKSTGEKLDAAIKKFEGQLDEQGKADGEIKAEVKALSDKFAEINVSFTDLAQKQADGFKSSSKNDSVAESFVKSPEFEAFRKGNADKARVEIKSTVLATPTTTTTPQYIQGVVPGAFRPLSVNAALPQMQTATDLVVLTRETAFTNNARGVTEGAAKPETNITFAKYNVTIETVAHWLKVSKQLMSDAPAVVSYIENRLNYGVNAKVDDQLLNGSGSSPELSGLLDSGNYTVYTPTSGDNLAEAINRAKYQLWAIGYVPDTAIVNPADWGALELKKATGSGEYLFGAPASMVNAGMNPFGVSIVISSQMPAGTFLVGNFAVSTGVWNRESTIVEMGYVNDDFTKNLVTLRAERRLGLEVSVPAAILGGDFTAS